MSEKIKEIRDWRRLYPEICKTDGLWQTVPKHYDGDQLLKAIRNIDTLLYHTSTLEEKVRELENNELRFPTLAEFSNLQEDYEKAESRIKVLEEAIEKHKNSPWWIRLSYKHDIELYSHLRKEKS